MHDAPLLRSQRPAGIAPEFGPVGDFAEKFTSVIAKLDLRPMLVVAAVCSDAAEQPVVFPHCRSKANFLLNYIRCLRHKMIFPFQESPKKNIFCRKNPVVAGISRMELCLAADPQSIPAQNSSREEFRSQQQNFRHSTRNHQCIEPPVSALGTVDRPEGNRLPDCHAVPPKSVLRHVACS